MTLPEGEEGQFEEQLAAHSRQELEQVRELLVESVELLQQALRLPVSSENLKGILTRQGAQVHCNAKLGKDAVQFQHAIPQMGVIFESLFSTNRLLALLGRADLATLLRAGRTAIQTLRVAQEALKAPINEAIFPQKVRPIQPGLGGEAYICQSELICTLYTYQDTLAGHQALSRHKINIGDPGLLAFSAKLEAGLHRVEHVVQKLRACV